MANASLKRLALARDIEEALKNYVGTDSFPTEEWPAIALAFADVIVQTGRLQAAEEPSLVMEEARSLVQKMADFDEKVADLVGL